MNERASAAGAVKKIWRAITGVISVVLLGILLWAVLILPNRMDVLMRDVNFPVYSQQSFAEVMAQFDPNGIWTYSARSIRAMRKAGSGYAMWSGHVDMAEDHGPCTSAPLSIRIDIRFNEDDTYQYGIAEIRIGGYCWDEEDMEDSPQTGQIMALLYGEHTGMSFPAYNRFGEPVEIYAAKPGTCSGASPVEPVEPDLPEPEQPETEVPAADTADTAALPAAAEALTGCWQDIDGYGYYLFIGEREGQLCATIRIYDELEFVLSGTETDSAGGSIMGPGSEPVYALDVAREGIRLYADLYVSETDELQSYTFVPADMETCPYADPYHPFQD